MKLPAIDKLMRSRYATALRMKSQKMRNQRTRLCDRSAIRAPAMRRDCGHAPAPRKSYHATCEKWACFDHAACDFRTFPNSGAIIFSSPGCNMKEFIDRTAPCSPESRTMDGLPLRKAAAASRGVSAIRAESHLMCMCGTWLAISGAGKEVVTPGILVI